MTITLPPETETMLRERAEKQRRSPDEVAVAILDEALLFEPETLEETVAGIERGLADCLEGRTRSLDDYIVAVREREGLPDSWPGSVNGMEITPGVFVAEE